MARYFKITEITEEEHFAATRDYLGYWEYCVSPEKDGVYVAINDEQADYFEIELSAFDEDASPDFDEDDLSDNAT